MLTKNFTDGEDFLKDFVSNKKYIILTSVTKEFCDMAINWFLSLEKIQRNKNAIIVAFDEYSYDKLKNNKIPCLFFNSNISKNDTFEDWVEYEKNTKVEPVYHIAKKYQHLDIFLSDCDIVFLKDFVYKVKKEHIGHDLIVTSDKRFEHFLTERKRDTLQVLSDDKKNVLDLGETPQSKYGIYNASFQFINNSNFRIRKKLSRIYDVFYQNSSYYKNFPKGKESGCLQTITNYRFKKLNLKIKTLSTFEFVNGSVWKIPYLKEKIKNNCYLVHYNFTDEKAPKDIFTDKMNWMKENNHWFL